MRLLLLTLLPAALAFVPATRPALYRTMPRVLITASADTTGNEPGAEAAGKTARETAGNVDMELTGSIIRYADLSEEFQQLVDAALVRRDRARLLNGQPKYGSVEGMIDAYVELGKPKGWTRVEAESEVVRYLQRQALRSEGGLDGSAQDTPTFVLLGVVVASAAYGLAVKYGLV